MFSRDLLFFHFFLSRAQSLHSLSPLSLSSLSLHSLSPLSLSLHRLSQSPGCSRDHYSCSKLHRATRLHSGSITALDTSSTTHRLRCCQSGCAAPLPCRKRSWRKSTSLLDLEALQGQGGGLGLWATTLEIRINAGGGMNAGLIILRAASESESGGTAAAAAPLQQQLRCGSSSVAAAAPSQQHYNLVLEWSSHRRVPPRGAALPRGTAGSISRRDAARQQHLEEGREMLLLRSMRSLVVAAAPSQQQQQQATAEPREDSRSTCSYMSESVSATQA